MSAQPPYRCTGRMALVRGVILRATSAGSRLSVSGSISANTTFAPRAAIALAVEIQLKGVVITSSPGPTPQAIIASSSPAVADVTAKPNCVPQYSANASSNAFTFGPHEGADALSTSMSAAASSSP